LNEPKNSIEPKLAMDTLHLYPSALARDRALDALGATAWTDRHRTFSEFIADLDPLTAAQPVAEGAARLEILSHVLQSRDFTASDRQRLGGSETALEAAAALIAAWKGHGLSPSDIQNAAAKMKDSGNAQVTATLARLFSNCEKMLTTSGWTDREGREKRVLENLAERKRLPSRLLTPGAPIELHGFHRLVPFQRKVLEKIRDLGHPLKINSVVRSSRPVVLYDERGTGRDARTTDVDLHAATFGSLAACFVPLSPPRERADTKRSGVPGEGAIGPAELLGIEAPTPYAEVYEIGRQVRDWIVNENIAPSEICVAFRDLGAYSQLIADVFRRFEIPYFERRGEPAAFQPIVRAALSAVQAAGTLTREDLFRFINSGAVDAGGLSGEKGATIDGLHELAMDACVDRFFGADRDNPAPAWTRRLNNYVTSLEHQANRARCERLARILNKIIERLDKMRASRKLGEHAKAWREFFNDAGLTANAIHAAPSDDPRVLRKNCMALEALDQALQSIAESPLKDKTVTLDEFTRSLERAIADQSVSADGAERGGVRVLNLYDLRGLQFKKVILGGMAEGVFPGLSGSHVLLGSLGTSELRYVLSLSKKGGSSELAWLEPLSHAEAVAEEEALFQIARTAAAGGTLVYARPQSDAEGRSIGPSIFWKDLAPSHCREATPIHPAPKMSECIIPEEIELRAAWVLGGGIADEQERNQAVAFYRNSPRLQQIARRGAIESRRSDFFGAQGLGHQAFDPSASGAEIALYVNGTSFDGIVGDAIPESKAIMTRRLLAETEQKQAPAVHVLSPNAIEKLAGCPFRFLVENVYALKEARLPDEELTPLDRGTVWHDILSAFYNEQLELARKASRMVAVLDPAREPEYLARLQSIAARILDALPQQAFVGTPGLWRLEQEKINVGLASWLSHEIRHSQSDGFYAACTEMNFGPTPTAHAPAVAVPITDSSGTTRELLLAGRMDRLDLKLADPNAAVPEVVALRVIDYKTGSRHSLIDKIKLDTLQKLLAVQLPIYIRAGLAYIDTLEKQNLLRVNRDAVWNDSQAGYYLLKYVPENNREKKLSLLELKKWPLESLKKFLSRDSIESGSLFDLLSKMVNGILEGRFPVKPAECAGAYCAARYVCRYQDVPRGEAGG
jgi:hypothetical protein